MNIQHKHIRMIEDAGQGAPVAFLRSSEPAAAKAIEILKKDFRVVTFDVGAAISPEGEAELLGAFARLGTSVGIISTGALAQQVLKLALQHPDVANAIVLIAPPAIADQKLAAELAGLKPPVLTLFGSKGGATAPEARRVYRQAIPKSHLMFVYDTDDGLAEQRPEAVAAALRDFMTVREGFLVTTRSAKLYP